MQTTAGREASLVDFWASSEGISGAQGIFNPGAVWLAKTLAWETFWEISVKEVVKQS